MKKEKELSKFLYNLINNSKKFFILGFIFGVFYGIFNTLSLWIFGSLFNIIFSSQDEINSLSSITNYSSFIGNLNEYLKGILYHYIYSPDKLIMIKKLTVIILLLFVLKNFFRYLTNLSLSYFVFNMRGTLKKYIAESILKRDEDFLGDKTKGELYSLFNSDIGMFQDNIKFISMDIVVQPITIITILYLLFSISVKLTLLSLLIFPLVSLFIYFVSLSLRRKSKRSLERIGKSNALFSEILEGFIIIKSFLVEKIFLKKFYKVIDEEIKYILKQTKLELLSSPVNETISITIGILIFIYGSKLVFVEKFLSGEDFVRFFTLIFGLIAPIKLLGYMHNKYNIAMGALERIYSFIKINQEESKKRRAIEYKEFSFNKSIKFKNVFFKYSNGENWTLEDLNIEIFKGDKIALIGKSGSGKTTFIKLLLKFLKPTKGEIFIDNINLNEIKTESLRKNISYMPQEIFIFNDTLENNILLNTNISSDTYKDLITNLSLDKIKERGENSLGENGKYLSGGERQRVVLARTIIPDKDFIIFDEPTSALDTKTEDKVIDYLFNEKKDKTIIIVTHKFKLIKYTNKVLMIENGKVKYWGDTEKFIEQNKTELGI